MGKKAYKVFLVDDDMKQLLLLKTHLEKHHQTKDKLDIQLISSIDDLLPRVAEKPDIIVLDYFLSGSDASAPTGLDVLRKIHKYDKDIKVIMMSGQEDMQVAIDSFEEGAFDYIIKNKTAFVRASIIVGNALKEIHKVEYEVRQRKAIRILSVLLIISAIVSMYILYEVFQNDGNIRLFNF